MKKAKKVSIIGIFLALFSLSPMLTVAVGGVIPITFQSFFALISGIVLGKRLGPVAVSIYVLLGLVGLPIFSGFTGGFGVVLTPNFGYLLGFILGSFIAGFLFEKLPLERKLPASVISCIVGSFFIYIIGVSYWYILFNYILGNSIDVKSIVILGVVPFAIGDILKSIFAGYIGNKVYSKLKIKE